MRIVKYTAYWAYGGKGAKREAPLSEFILDIQYLMENTGVIPPLDVLNQVLGKGGSSGGMGPGTKWRPFQIDDQEYKELVQGLIGLDIDAMRQHHPYIRFSRITIDVDLNELSDYRQWLKESFAKYYASHSSK